MCSGLPTTMHIGLVLGKLGRHDAKIDIGITDALMTYRVRSLDCAGDKNKTAYNQQISKKRFLTFLYRWLQRIAAPSTTW